MQTPLVATDRWPPTRDEAERRLADFVPRAGRQYAANRNYDRGPDQRDNVSTLSPYVRHRVLTEAEIVTAVLARFALSGAEKFVQEVFWRTYWKGWLETHPSAWSRYRETLADRLTELDADADLTRAYDDATNGRTGIDAFDAWARELVGENYLHNHARMWFASIWIFTLGLPWELGADFFMRHLLDGDPASNTLSWRWVAGLHTRGKTYTATRDNIRRYTEDRFAVERSLGRGTVPLEDAPIPLVPLRALPPPTLPDEPSLLVLHDDDLHGDLTELPLASIAGVSAIDASAGRSPRPVSPAVSTFTATLAREAISRVAARASARDGGIAGAAGIEGGADSVGGDDIAGGADIAAIYAKLVAAADACGARRIIAPFAPVGPARDLLDGIRTQAAAEGRPYAEFLRRYDAASWPAATRGFFNVRSRIPAIVAELGLG